MRLIDADELRNELTSICSDKVNDYNKAVKAFIEFIDNAPTVCNDNYSMGYQDGVKKVLSERPHGECRTCKYYHPYYEQLTNIPRGDGYCVIARMTPEGMTTINCNDEFSCSDYQKSREEALTMDEERKVYIIQSKAPDKTIKTYSVSATTREECLKIFNDYKENENEVGEIVREMTPAQYREYKRV